MVWRLATLALMASLGGMTVATAAEPAPAGAREYIIWPKNGQVIKGGVFWLRMGLSQAGIAPAGVHKEGTGHHHLLIDTELPPPGEPIPNNRNHLHFGGGQTEVKIELPPGRHTLQLILGDADHVPFEPSIVSQQITVIVP